MSIFSKNGISFWRKIQIELKSVQKTDFLKKFTFIVARQIMEEEAAVMTSPGMARSPAMHQGFRQEEWIVERTPVNTPEVDKVVVGMINLSDEETSNHVDSDVVFKSSTAATSPQEGSIFDSMAELPADDIVNVQVSYCPNWAVETRPDLGSGYCVIQDFSIIQILREINFQDTPSAKSTILTHLKALNFDL